MKFPIKETAKLARIELTEEQEKKFSVDIEKLIEHFDKLSEVDTTGVKPLIWLSKPKVGQQKHNTYPEDALILKDKQDGMNVSDGFVIVPKVIE